MDNDLKRANLERWVKLIGIGVVGLVVSPIIFLTIQGIVGLFVAGAIGLIGIQLAPVFAFKLANWRMKLITAEASKNPIETMKNLYVEKFKELEAADRNIVEFEAEIGNFDDQVITFKKQYPEEAPRYVEISQKMHQGLIEMEREQQFARAALQDFEMKIKKAEAIYRMALAAARVTQFSKSAESRVFDQIKEQVAFDSVRTSLNRSFAQLNVAINKRQELSAGRMSETPSASVPGAAPAVGAALPGVRG